MTLFIWILIALQVNDAVGCIVMRQIDNASRDLYHWYKSAPYAILKFLFIQLWPITLFFWWRNRKWWRST